jgi:two-component system, NtrC family, response regulator AlgB
MEIIQENDRPKLVALVVDDEVNIRKTLSLCLESMGYVARSAASAGEALAAMEREFVNLAFVDLRLRETDGLDLLPQMFALRPNLAVVVITAYASFATAVEAIKRGAMDYLPKPFTPEQIRHVVDRIMTGRAMTRRLTELEDRLAREIPEVDLSTSSPPMQAVLEIMARAAKSDAAVLLRGENGTGKGVLARAIHAQSPRSDGPFITVHCPTLSEQLLVSELFGHARGAFTGALQDQMGRVEAAEGGTLFLDEIGELPPGLQAKLLRFIQEKQFERVGESKTRFSNARILTATNRDLEQDIQQGRFREDLFFRLNVIEIRLPPLRERTEDILNLARGYLSFFARTAGRLTPILTADAETALIHHPWPGNLRELRNAMERSVILHHAQELGVEALPFAASPRLLNQLRLGGDCSLAQIEREHILRVLQRVPTQEEAASVLGIDASTLWRKRKQYESENIS